MQHVYLDHQAATPLLPEVFEAMRPFLTGEFGNPSSSHALGLKARDAVGEARASVASFINAESPDDIIFTSDGTESANLAVKGVAWANEKRGNHIIVGQIEHPSVIQSTEFLKKHGFVVSYLPVDAKGFIDPAEVRKAITNKTTLVAVHHVNHDIGTIEPIAEMAKITAEAGATFYVDAEASAGWLDVDVQKLGADLLSFSPHRIYGPKGVGVLYRNRRARLTSLLHGGNQENGHRAGIENVAAIVGAGALATIAEREAPAWRAHVALLQQKLWQAIDGTIPHVRFHGPEPGQERSPANLNLSPEFVEGESQVLMCDLQGISIAGATGCVSKSLKVSPVLAAIGVPHSLAQSAIILSLGKDNTSNEIEYVTKSLAGIVSKLRGMSPVWDEFRKGGAG